MTATHDRQAEEPPTGTENQPAWTERSYLLVFQKESANLLQLPADGEVVLGRDPEEQISIEPERVSQIFARLSLHGWAATVESVPESPAILINGEILAGFRFLASGDMITAFDTHIVFHRNPQARTKPSVLNMGQMTVRIEQEVARSVRYQHPVSILAIKIGVYQAEDQNHLCEAVMKGVRFVDIVGWNGSDEFIVIFLETAETSHIPTKRVLDALLPWTGHASAGLSCCPFDGTDHRTLLAGARAAAKNAEPGTVRRLYEATHILSIGDEKIVAVDPRMKRLFTLVEDLAHSDLPVLITGETGSGKEIVAKALHLWSSRKDRPLVSINCAAMTESLLESELFGHVRGAFSGAEAAKPGLLESADGGTVFLDEVSNSSPRTQAELLRVLETKRIRRVGSVEEVPVDVRIVAATNQLIEHEVQNGRFRQDLYYRLNGSTLDVPALRERKPDIPVMAQFFLQKAAARAGRGPMFFAQEAMEDLLSREWPGNVRQLRNLVDKLVAIVHEPLIQPKHLPAPSALESWALAERREADAQASQANPPEPAPAEEPTPRRRPRLADEIQELERKRIQEALAAAQGVRVKAAAIIGMPLRTFVAKLKRYRLS